MADATRLAVVPGTFDPLTNGHLDLIRRSATLFDRVVVAVLVNAAKQPWFSADERVAMIRAETAEMPRVEVDTFGGLLAEYVRLRGASAVVRGLRTATEFSDEWQIALMNRHLNEKCETVFVMPSVETMFLSSRLVREVASHDGSIEALVPASVARRLRERQARLSGR
ncbi:MAG: pantetheine-phosphate adenylyltransferase [Vicinamibacterales bacterium]